MLPPYSLGLMSLIGLLLMRKRPQWGQRLIGASLALLVLLSFPVWSYWAQGGAQPSASDVRSFVPGPFPPADAIVILGGGRRRYAVEYGAPETADYSTIIRLRYGARLYKQYGYPILVSGGRPHLGLDRGTLAEGDIMKDILEKEYGIPVKWVESQADDTLDNAQKSAPLLKNAGVKTIYLVTDADHAPRARDAFVQQGFEVIATPTLFYPPRELSAQDFIPSFQGLSMTRHVLYNILNQWRARLMGSAST